MTPILFFCVAIHHSNSVAAQGTATVFTDGLAQPSGEISLAMAQLSDELSKSGKLRLLSMMGRAGIMNLHDLMRFRGADFAILNNDIIANPDLPEKYPNYDEKLRYITKLNSQKLLIFARAELGTLKQLSDKNIVVFGPETITGFTARRVLNLLSVDAKISSAFEGGAAKAALGSADAIILFDTEYDELRHFVDLDKDYRAIAIPENEALTPVYRIAQIGPGEFDRASSEPAISTIEVDTILATFNWLPKHGRYSDVSTFIDAFFELLPTLRNDYPSSIWNATDPQAAVLGWRQYDLAKSKAKTVRPPNPAPIATVPAFVSSLEDQKSHDALGLSIMSQPPLTNQNAGEGGILTELAIAAIKRSEILPGKEIAIRWERDLVAQVEHLMSNDPDKRIYLWLGPNCDQLAQLSAEMAAMCDGVVLSEPIFSALNVFFVTEQSDFDPGSADGLSGRTICAPANRPFAPPFGDSEHRQRKPEIKILRPPSTVDCLGQIQLGKADALFVNEMEGKKVIADLGLTNTFRTIENVGFAQETRMMVAKKLPNATKIVTLLNEGIRKLKSEAIYGQLILKHVIPAPKAAAMQ